MKKTTIEIDEHFIARVYRTSAWVWAIGLLAALSVGAFYFAIGWTVGSAMSVGILWSLDYIIRKTIVPGAEGARSSLAKFSVVKLARVEIVLEPFDLRLEPLLCGLTSALGGILTRVLEAVDAVLLRVERRVVRRHGQPDGELRDERRHGRPVQRLRDDAVAVGAVAVWHAVRCTPSGSDTHRMSVALRQLFPR